jgi:hypothetical protein
MNLNFKNEEMAYNKHRVQLLKCWKIHMDICTGFWCHYLFQYQEINYISHQIIQNIVFYSSYFNKNKEYL